MRRHALLIGVNRPPSQHADPLSFAVNDAQSLAKVLSSVKYGYECRTLLEEGATRDAIFTILGNGKLDSKAPRMEPDDDFLFFFAGHGQKTEGTFVLHTYEQSKTHARHFIAMPELVAAFQQLPCRRCMCILDACRGVLSEGGRGGAASVLDYQAVVQIQSAIQLRPEKFTEVLFGCSEGQASWEDPDAEHGVLTKYLLHVLNGVSQDCELEFEHVAELTGKLMEGWRHPLDSSIRQEPFLYRPARRDRIPLLPGNEITNSIGMRLRTIPQGTGIVGTRKDDPGFCFMDREAREVTLDKFYISTHPVTASQFRQFLDMSGYVERPPVEQSELIDIVFDRNTSLRDKCETLSKKSLDFPMLGTNFHDAQAFCVWLAATCGGIYAIPSEDEWEIACRGRTQTVFSCGDTLLENHAVFNRGVYTMEEILDERHMFARFGLQHATAYLADVDLLEPNPFGIYCMEGGMFEWCNTRLDYNEVLRRKLRHCELKACKIIRDTFDLYLLEYLDDDDRLWLLHDFLIGEGELYVLKGGCWTLRADQCRPSSRMVARPDVRHLTIGFRVVWYPKTPDVGDLSISE